MGRFFLLLEAEFPTGSDEGNDVLACFRPKNNIPILIKILICI
jgi:hypothetical protein